MRKQVLKTLMMLSILVILAVLPIHAQSGAGFFVSIPFDFNVAGKTLPAGQYIVRRNTQSSTEGLVMRSTDGRSGVFVLTREIQSGEKQETSKLVFNRYGDQYFLAQVWRSGRSYGRELPKSRAERTAEREMAKNALSPQRVAIISTQQ